MSETEPTVRMIKATEGTGVRDTSTQLVNYATLTQVKTGLEEIALHFGHTDEDNALSGQGFAKIYLSVPHAKRLLVVLQSSISDYEKIFGEIIADPTQRITAEGRQFVTIEEPNGSEDATQS